MAEALQRIFSTNAPLVRNVLANVSCSVLAFAKCLMGNSSLVSNNAPINSQKTVRRVASFGSLSTHTIPVHRTAIFHGDWFRRRHGAIHSLLFPLGLIASPTIANRSSGLCSTWCRYGKYLAKILALVSNSLPCRQIVCFQQGLLGLVLLYPSMALSISVSAIFPFYCL